MDNKWKISKHLSDFIDECYLPFPEGDTPEIVSRDTCGGPWGYLSSIGWELEVIEERLREAGKSLKRGSREEEAYSQALEAVDQAALKCFKERCKENDLGGNQGGG